MMLLLCPPSQNFYTVEADVLTITQSQTRLMVGMASI